MSYSFISHAATKAELKSMVADQINAVVKSQPVHKADQRVSLGAANALIDALADDDKRDFQATVAGSLDVVNTDQVQQANLTITTQLIKRQ